jgi:hypothetical protein
VVELALQIQALRDALGHPTVRNSSQ